MAWTAIDDQEKVIQGAMQPHSRKVNSVIPIQQQQQPTYVTGVEMFLSQ